MFIACKADSSIATTGKTAVNVLNPESQGDQIFHHGPTIRPDFRIAALNANGLGAKESELSKELEAPIQRSS